jgi:hypothetical protein
MAGLSLEELMADRENRTYEVKTTQNTSQKSDIQTSDKSANLYDFIKMVNKLSTIVLKDLNVDFVPDENKNIVDTPDLKLEHPVITYKVIWRKPKGELKPRVRQQINEITDDPNDERLGEVYGQKFDCLIQFNIYASVYDIAEQVMERFEEMIFTYTGWMKKNGIGEVLFEQQLTDENYDMFRQTISIRNIRFRVVVEKLHVIFQEKIKEIETLSL